MNKVKIRLSVVLGLVMSSGSVYALERCKVDIKNEVHLDGKQVEVVASDTSKLRIDEESNLYINGERVNLNELQQDALNSYRENMNTYVPQARELAQNGLSMSNDLLDDVAKSFDNSQAFQNVKDALAEFFADVESRYYQNGEFVLKSEAFSSFLDHWQEDFDKAREVFNSEFFSSAFTAMSDKMKADGGLNLSELSQEMDKLKSRLAETMANQKDTLKKQASDYCESLNDVAEQEQDLQQKIPELKDYQVFTI
jgi:uncharacterized coiled-coil DUF342 family protein